MFISKTPDRTSKKNTILKENSKLVLENHQRAINDEYGPDANSKKVADKVRGLMEGDSLTHKVLKRKRNSMLREEKRTDMYSKLSTAMAAIVLEAAPIDPEAKEKYGESILNNSKKFMMSLFESRDMTINSFKENPSEMIQDFGIACILGEEEDIAGIIPSTSAKVAELVKSKTETVIKEEIKNEKEREEIISDIQSKRPEKGSLNESKSLGIYKSIGAKRKSSFNTLFKESIKTLINESAEVDMDLAIGDAAIKYTLVEALNTMNLIKEPVEIVEKLVAFSQV